jgi:hypothetical protein
MVSHATTQCDEKTIKAVTIKSKNQVKFTVTQTVLGLEAESPTNP